MSDKNYGIAIDVGTTTVAVYLVDMETGVVIATTGDTNAQDIYGADVTSRIRYSSDNGHEKPTQVITEQLSSMIKAACVSADVKTEQIIKITVAANTVMQHLVAGLSPVSLGKAPFTPVSLFGGELPVWDNLPVADNAKIYYTPAVSAYVGGDITAGLFAADFENENKPALFIDIGTNGELVLKHKDTYYCCATAAGPAFEGAEITKGMAAIDGAVDHVWSGGSGKIEFSVIGGGRPKGLCGSGLLDLLAVLLDIGTVDSTGRLLGKDRFYLDEASDIFITAEDIRKLQLAKAAIAAGIEVLLHFAGISETDVKLLALAGGFGSYMDLKSAARIGLIPKSLLPVAKVLGNTAGEGAVKTLLCSDAQERLEKIREHCEYVELSSIAFFNDKFVEQMGF
ncbi:MAG: ASKHA domain-containing protein [Oscillospiraceae bacterium]|nr:ASKHA domain-containing protein [Oscillospiraceae bacterium]